MIVPTISRLSDDRGSTPLQTAILAPVMLLLLGLIIQGGMWFHARDVAIAAAEEGARAAAIQDSTSGAGETAAAAFAGRVGAGVLKEVITTGTRSGTTATMVVTGRSLSLVPGLTITISQSATVPVERTT